MIVTAILVLASLVGVAASVSRPDLGDFILLAGPCAVASIILLFRESKVRLLGRGDQPARVVVVDGSNVMYWRDGTPRIEPVQEVVRHLVASGFTIGVMFDANAGHLFAGAYRDDKAISKLLGLPQKDVMVVPSGRPADPYILDAARERGGVIISNDRFRDWAADYPEVQNPGHLIKGEYRQGGLWFDFANDDWAEQGTSEIRSRAG